MGNRICPCGNEIPAKEHGNRRHCTSCRPRQLAKPKPLKPLKSKTCEVCKKTFDTKQNHAKYCGRACAWIGRAKKPCEQCGSPTGYSPGDNRKSKYLCMACKKALTARKLKDKCKVVGCEYDVLARGVCGSHYSSWHRKQLKYTVQCHCGKTAQVQRKRIKHCSYQCGMDAVNAAKAGMDVHEWLRRPEELRGNRSKQPVIKFKQCRWCLQLHDGKDKWCSEQCRYEEIAAKASNKSKIERSRMFRKAFEQGDYQTFFAELRARCIVDMNGCWLWQRKLNNGYPVQNWGNKWFQVHRLSLEAKHGKPLGSQSAHHICAVAACVNPDHLQPVTHRDNVAEMLQRHSYLKRIDELEAALAQLAPTHPLLNVIEVA